MGAAEHLKTLCCLGIDPESLMVSLTPLLHEIVPHGWSRMGLLETDSTIGATYSENPVTASILRERMWRFTDDPTSPMSLWRPSFQAHGIGWTLPMQGRGWQESSWYRDIEACLDSCWLLDAMIGEDGPSSAVLVLTRPRTARPFVVEDVQCLDRLRPWLAHALRRPAARLPNWHGETPDGRAGAPVRSGQIVLTSDSRMVYQTAGLEFLIRALAGEPSNYMRYVPAGDRLPAPISKLLARLAGAAKGLSNAPPRMQISTAYGIVALEAKWLVPAGELPADVVKDPQGCLIAVTIELHEQTVAYAARVLRESGATPAQVRVGIQLAFGKTKPVIADELGLQRSSVADLAKKLYQRLDVHNSTELAMKIWLDRRQTGLPGLNFSSASVY